MKFLIISSKKDIAGTNIYNYIKTNLSEIECVLIEEETINADSLDEQFKGYDFFIFATRHQSQQHRKTFSLHAPGNWGKADYGGKAGSVCNTSSFLLKKAFQILNQEAKKKEGFEVTLEVTHHGPDIKTPCIFIEIGTTNEEWNDKQAAEIIANTIKQVIGEYQENDNSWIPAIAVGGPHYCPAFNKIQSSSKYSVSHIIPQYVFPIKEGTIKEAVLKTKEKVDTVIIDWKGLKSEERNYVIETCKILGLEIVRSNSII